jgi:hypothetical protein
MYNSQAALWVHCVCVNESMILRKIIFISQ